MSTNTNIPIEQLLQPNKDVVCLKDTLNSIDQSTKRTQKLVEKALKLIDKLDYYIETLQIETYLNQFKDELDELKQVIQEERNEETETVNRSNYNLREKKRVNYNN